MTIGSTISGSPELRREDGLRRSRRRGWVAFPAIAVALVVGVAGGAAAMKMVRPSPEMASMTPVAIAKMPTSGLVTVKGTVAEIYGNKFILQDDSGKALVETGRAGEGGQLVTQNEPVTVQGRFDHGFVHASYLVDKDGKTDALLPPDPLPPPQAGPLDGEARP
ncbi:hypothetical protein ACIQUB_22135 [Rhizobium sp. NPDC090275]|uniref:hypothetical protein n=1 Tax=Rhizobium sp. NPDC090275 TaxID=3364498 RepID=UPI00383B46EE